MRRRIEGLLQLEVVRFGGVGVINTCLDLSVYFLLQLAGVPFLLANLVSTATGLGFSFAANRFFTFRARPSTSARKQALLFLVCTGVGLWVVQPVMIFAVGQMLTGAGVQPELRILLSKLAAIACGMVWNWTLYNKVVFRAANPVESTLMDPIPPAPRALYPPTPDRHTTGAIRHP